MLTSAEATVVPPAGAPLPPHKRLVRLLRISVALASFTFIFSTAHIYVGLLSPNTIAFGLTVPHHLFLAATIAKQAAKPASIPVISPFSPINLVFTFLLVLAWAAAVTTGILVAVATGGWWITVVFASVFAILEFFVMLGIAIYCTVEWLHRGEEEDSTAPTGTTSQDYLVLRSLTLPIHISLFLSSMVFGFAASHIYLPILAPNPIAFGLTVPYQLALLRTVHRARSPELAARPCAWPFATRGIVYAFLVVLLWATAFGVNVWWCVAPRGYQRWLPVIPMVLAGQQCLVTGYIALQMTREMIHQKGAGSVRLP